MPRFPRALSLFAVLVVLSIFLGYAAAEPQAAPRFTDPVALYDSSSAVVAVAAESGRLDYTVGSMEGQTVRTGSVPVVAGAAAIDLVGLGPNYFQLTVSNRGGQSNTALGIVDDLSRTPAASLFGTTAHPAIHNPALNHAAAATAVGVNIVRLDWRWEDAVTEKRSVFSWDPATEGESTVCWLKVSAPPGAGVPRPLR